jgi:2-polyprenyl-6-methoxyphenol hydroxylase-like FAD-dependent oxidoreductase
MSSRTSTAIVLGAGIGGLLAAGVLSRYFTRVELIERDRLPSTPLPRIGVPQGPQVHAVMKRGEMAIEGILPGFRERLAAAGGTTLRVGLDLIYFEGGGWHPKNDLGFTISTQTRALLEHVIRGRLLENGNVTIREGRRFRGLMFDEDDGRVLGVEVQDDGLETVPANLVIDAMGRSSPMPGYLGDRGLGEAPVHATGISISYSTILLHVPKRWLCDPWACVLRATAPDRTRGATMTPIEGNRWLLSMVSRFGDQLPTELTDCVAFTESLETPEIFERVRHAELAVKAKRFQIPESRVTCFDQMSDYPMGLLPLGDVIGTFNPLLAQGMTIAALHAETLGAKLAAHVGLGQELNLASLAADYIPAVTELSVKAWTAGVYADMLYPATKGERPADFDDYHAFRRALRGMMLEDPEIHRLAVRVTQLLDPPSVLPRDEILARVVSESVGSCRSDV